MVVKRMECGRRTRPWRRCPSRGARKFNIVGLSDGDDFWAADNHARNVPGANATSGCGNGIQPSRSPIPIRVRLLDVVLSPLHSTVSDPSRGFFKRRFAVPKCIGFHMYPGRADDPDRCQLDIWRRNVNRSGADTKPHRGAKHTPESVASWRYLQRRSASEAGSPARARNEDPTRSDHRDARMRKAHDPNW